MRQDLFAGPRFTSQRPPLPYYGWRYDTGPGPASPVWPRPPAAPSRTPLEARADRLEAFRRACWAALAAARRGEGTPPVSSSDIAWLNRECRGIRRLNDTLRHPRGSSEVAAWPDPALPATILLGPRDLLPWLDGALVVLASAIAQAAQDARELRR